MKKTLVTILCLSGLSSGLEPSAALTFNPVLGEDATWSSGVSFVTEIEQPELTWTFRQITGASSGSIAADKYVSTGLSPSVQFQSGQNGKDYWTLEFSITNNAEYAITLLGIATVMNATTSSGDNHTNGIGNMHTTLHSSGTELGTAYASLGENSSSGTSNIKLQNGWELAAGETQVFTLTFDRKSGEGGHTGYLNVSSFTVSFVPEPATATLSLLALCGLAARRRRR